MSPAPVAVTLSVAMSAPSFVPGSLLSATITLHADRPPSLPPSPFGPESSALANYIVCEVSGRWSADRAWVLPNAHPPATASTLDNHARPPIAEQPALFAHTPPEQPWAPALADANAVGGGGRPGNAGIIFRSQALVVCEREQIPVGSRVSFGVSCVLPDTLPPTLRGIAVRYTYALVVVAHFPGCQTPKTVRVPFRVVSAGGTGEDVERVGRVIPVPTPRSAGPVPNRFLEEVESRALCMEARLLKSAPPDDIEIALALSLNGRLTPYRSDADCRRVQDDLQDGALSFIREAKFVTTPKSGASHVEDVSGEEGGQKGVNKAEKKKNAIPLYGISFLNFPVARMYLSKRVHHLGDTLSAIFHFNGTKPCYRVDARLEVQEVIQHENAVGQKQGTGHDPSQPGVVFRTVYGEHGEFVMSNKNTHVTFSIPHDAPPSFSTSLVTIRWLIHFIFLIPHTSPKPRRGEGDRGAVDEVRSLIDELQISENGAPPNPRDWEGGTWSGEDPTNRTHLPQKHVDVLRWTLPIVVSGQPDSQWGTSSTGRLVYAGSET